MSSISLQNILDRLRNTPAKISWWRE